MRFQFDSPLSDGATAVVITLVAIAVLGAVLAHLTKPTDSAAR